MTGASKNMPDKAVLFCLSEYNYLKDETVIIAWPQTLPKKQKEVVVRTSVQLHEKNSVWCPCVILILPERSPLDKLIPSKLLNAT